MLESSTFGEGAEQTSTSSDFGRHKSKADPTTRGSYQG